MAEPPAVYGIDSPWYHPGITLWCHLGLIPSLELGFIHGQ